MIDLTQKYLAVANLVPSAMSAGGEIHANTLAMTAPGSQAISSPMPDDPGQPHESLPMPVDTNQVPIPVSNAPKKPRAGAVPGGPPWSMTYETSGTWKEI